MWVASNGVIGAIVSAQGRYGNVSYFVQCYAQFAKH